MIKSSSQLQCTVKEMYVVSVKTSLNQLLVKLNTLPGDCKVDLIELPDALIIEVSKNKRVKE